MSPRLDISRLSAPKRWLLAGAITALMLVVLSVADRSLILELAEPEKRDDSWRWALKQVGDIRLWLAVAVLAFIVKRDWRWPAGLLGSAALAGGLAELAKLVIGRERPVRDFVIQQEILDGAHYVWKDGPLGPFLAGFWDSSNLGLPSSHTAVAFGGAAVLGVLAPNLRLPALILATGCGLTRVLAGAHFPTDVALGAAIGVASAALIARIGRATERDTMPASETTT
ncbi:MAG: phosphatase PAP2 family protein [Phycisphaerales bacterium]